MIRAEITGRLVAAPSRRRTNLGIMASTTVAVDVTHRRPATELVALSAVGRAAAQLLQFRAGDAVTAVGRLTKLVWTVPDSEEHSSYWSLQVDRLVSVRDQPPSPRQLRNAYANRGSRRDSSPELPADGVNDLRQEDRR
jgi:hypothetical protein